MGKAVTKSFNGINEVHWETANDQIDRRLCICKYFDPMKLSVLPSGYSFQTSSLKLLGQSGGADMGRRNESIYK